MEDNEITKHLNSISEESRNIFRKWASTTLLKRGEFVKYSPDTVESVIYWREYAWLMRN